MKLLYIFLGGGIGSILRYLIGIGITKTLSLEKFPVGTLGANFISCMLLALFIWLTKNEGNQNFRLFFITGICGGLSTFSTFGWESVQLVQQGKISWAIANVVLSLLLCLPLLYWAAQKNTTT
jgi:fluoride exporter